MYDRRSLGRLSRQARWRCALLSQTGGWAYSLPDLVRECPEEGSRLLVVEVWVERMLVGITSHHVEAKRLVHLAFSYLQMDSYGWTSRRKRKEREEEREKRETGERETEIERA